MDVGQDSAAPAGTGAVEGARVTVRYWAGARAAAGVEAETLDPPGTVGALVVALAEAHPGLEPVLPVCSVLVDGLAGGPATAVPPGSVIEILPPFAGG